MKKKNFDCVAFQRKVRGELSALYFRDRERFFREIKQAAKKAKIKKAPSDRVELR